MQERKNVAQQIVSDQGDDEPAEWWALGNHVVASLGFTRMYLWIHAAALPLPPTRKEKGPIERRAHVLSKVRGAGPRRRQVLRGMRLAAARRGSPGRKRSGGG